MNFNSSTLGYTEQRQKEKAQHRHLFSQYTVNQDIENGTKITASMVYYLMTAVIWSSAGDKQMNPFFAFCI